MLFFLSQVFSSEKPVPTSGLTDINVFPLQGRIFIYTEICTLVFYFYIWFKVVTVVIVVLCSTRNHAWKLPSLWACTTIDVSASVILCKCSFFRTLVVKPPYWFETVHISFQWHGTWIKNNKDENYCMTFLLTAIPPIITCFQTFPCSNNQQVSISIL